jgi:thiamine-monophosphate kinase
VRVADLGEFPLIERLKKIVDIERPDIVVGIDDDAAVLASHGDELLLATVDSHIENVHFLPYLGTPRQLGRRALVVNLSDIAGMGGQPQFALVSLALPAETEVEWLEEFYRGMRTEADRFNVAIVGGNVTRSPAGVRADITVLGRVHRDNLMLRSGAQPGDKVLVVDRVGEAFAGLHLVFDPRLPVAPAVREKLITRYIEPDPRLPEAAVIARSGAATAMLDVSDGLAGDLGHICEQSSVGARIWADRLPISPEARRVAEAMNTPAWQFALEGGDDYGLCLTARADSAEQLCADVERETGTTVSIIGEIVPPAEGRRLVLPGGQDIPLDVQAWQHFSASAHSDTTDTTNG